MTAAHDHAGSHPSDAHAPEATRRALFLSLVINTVFFVVILVGAILAGSVTLLAEAAHMLTDSLSLVVALVAAWVAGWTPDADRTYGYRRAEVIGGFLNGLLLLAVVGYVAYEALLRFLDPVAINAPIVIVVGSIGFFANIAAAWVLLDHRGSLNVEGAFLHLVADAAGSLAAIVLGVALVFTDLYILDPLFALLIAALVLYSVKDLVFDSVNILLQGTPRDVDIRELTDALAGVERVEDVHDVHVWAIDSSRTALSAHVVVAPDSDIDGTLVRARDVAADFGIDHATIQIESGEFCETRELDCYPVER